MLSVVVYPGPGHDLYSLQLSNALCKYCRVAYICDVKQYERFQKSLNPKVNMIPFRKPRLREIWGILEIIRLALRINAFKPDVVNLHGNGLWESLLISLLPHISVINTVHDPIKHFDNKNTLNIWTMKYAIYRASAWVVHSQKLKDLFIEQNRVDPTRVIVYPHGVYDFYNYFATNPIKRENFILFFGELRYNKGIDLLLRAFQPISNNFQHWHVVVAGRAIKSSPDISPFVKSLGTQLILKDRFIEDIEVAEFFSKAGIVALPYREASQSGVLTIAAAFGCPVLATSVGSIPELVEHEKQAYLVEPENVSALKNGLESLMLNDNMRSRIGENLYIHAMANWSWEKAAKIFVEFCRNRIAH
jgi:glycosyltransferase involved in cell wall biosynthesis